MAWLAALFEFKSAMRPPVAMAIYLLAVFMGAALIAPWFYLSSHWLGETLHATGITRHPFHRYVSRSLMAFAIIGLFPFLRSLQLRSWGAVGIRKSPKTGFDLGCGLFLGFSLLGIVALAACLSGARVFDLHQHTGEILKHLLNASLAAIFASILEELLFRGVLFGGLRKRLAFWSAALLSAAVYALVHFFERPASPAQIDWASGFVVLGRMLEGFNHFEKLVPGFFNLALLGCILALAYERSKTLYFSIGLHTGLIFWVKTYSFFTSSPAGTSNSFWGSGKLVDGWVSTIALGVGLLLVQVLRPKFDNLVVSNREEDPHTA
jgi:membrane protease YdiL (CAAX protease family)